MLIHVFAYYKSISNVKLTSNVNNYFKLVYLIKTAGKGISDDNGDISEWCIVLIFLTALILLLLKVINCFWKVDSYGKRNCFNQW